MTENDMACNIRSLSSPSKGTRADRPDSRGNVGGGRPTSRGNVGI